MSTTHAPSPDLVPVIVGIGQVNDRPAAPADGLDPASLMAAALQRADDDAGGAGGWLRDCDGLSAVAQIGWPDMSPIHDAVAERLGIAPPRLDQTAQPSGESPVRLLHEAANRIGAGEERICAIVGGEALRTAAARPAAPRDAIRDAPHRRHVGYAQRHGLVVPTDVYPLYENAMRAAAGQSLAEGQAETGTIWSAMSAVAAETEGAWLRRSVAAQDIVTPGPDNRPVAFPYTKLQVANMAVNMGAGFLVTSLGEARRRGVPDGRLVHVGHGAAAREDTDILRRADYVSSPSLSATIAENGLAAGDIDLAELYSCFPCIPKLALRELGWPAERPATVFGGLTFGGGPIGNYMSHAIAAMTGRLRGTAQRGLLVANGGYATYNHAIVLGGAATGAAFPQAFDRQAAADARRGPVPPLDEGYEGHAKIETYTVLYDRAGAPRQGIVVARTPAGARTAAIVEPEDARAIDMLTDGTAEPVGRTGLIVRRDGGMGYWRMSV